MDSDRYDGGRPGDRYAEVDRSPLTVMVLLAAVAAFQLVHHYPNLPETIATHFGASGQADGWSGTRSFMLIYGVIEGAMVVGAFLIARFAMRIPTGALNIPNRDYWLEPERRSESLHFVWSRVLWMMAATLAFLIAVAEIVFRSNLTPGPPALTRDFLIVLVVFVAVTGWFSLGILTRFRLPKP
ncbi:MAG: DUF1648 domain-containing protein [Candidatus Eisenbacteria bacterium]